MESQTLTQHSSLYAGTSHVNYCGSRLAHVLHILEIPYHFFVRSGDDLRYDAVFLSPAQETVVITTVINDIPSSEANNYQLVKNLPLFMGSMDCVREKTASGGIFFSLSFSLNFVFSTDMKMAMDEMTMSRLIYL
jgi:hypothetical protein